jgi:hypothetical protein
LKAGKEKPKYYFTYSSNYASLGKVLNNLTKPEYDEQKRPHGTWQHLA